MVEFVLIYWAMQDRWTVSFSNGASLCGAQLRTLHDAESAALEVLALDRATFAVQGDPDTDVVRYRPTSWKGVQVRSLDEAERERFRECLEWIQFPGIRLGEPADCDDASTRARYDGRVEEARRRWPDVARLIGF